MHRGDRIVGRFEILGEVARGGMGTVFRARDVRSRRDVAVKLVSAVTPEAAGRFAREAAILAAVRDPAIVEYIAHGTIAEGPSFLVMEWVDGETLAHRLDRGGLPTGTALAICAQVAGALATLHAADVMHRDVKPANLMIIGDRAKLVDFGIARSRAERLTRTGSLVGTAGYMAPEQARGDAEIDDRADVFALGCVLYECVTGAPAFRGDHPLALRAKVLLHDPPRLRALVPALPDELDRLVARMLSREADARPTAAEVMAALPAIDVAASDRAAVPLPPAEPSPADHPTCAVLIALEDRSAIRDAAQLATAQPLDGGAIALCTELAEAATLAASLEAQFPSAIIALAAGESPGAAIDRSARLIAQLEIAGAAGAPTAGAWVDPATRALGNELVTEPSGGHARLRGLVR